MLWDQQSSILSFLKFEGLRRLVVVFGLFDTHHCLLTYVSCEWEEDPSWRSRTSEISVDLSRVRSLLNFDF